MTEEEALAWVEARFDPAIVERLHTFAAMVIDENMRQNLISPASMTAIWSRHIVDSLQLLAFAPATGMWIDIGTGGGFPGMVVAIARGGPVMLVEPRRKRADFLQQSVDRLELPDTSVAAAKIERVVGSAAVISARAVDRIENLLRAAAHCATPKTRWLLPRGSIDRTQLKALAADRRLMFHVEQSLTSEASSIVVLEAR